MNEPIPAKRRCTASTRAGRPCRAWAMGDSDPPRCASHAGRGLGNQNARKHGFYARYFTGRELADLVALADDRTLADEIALARVALRRLFAYLEEEAPPAEITTIIPLVMRSTGRIARLLRDQQLISGQAADDLLAGIAGALEILNAEWGTDL